MMRAALLVLCLLGAGAAHAAPASITIGDIILDYDDAAWRVVSGTDGATISPAKCEKPRCMVEMGIVVHVFVSNEPFPAALSPGDATFARSLWALLAGARDDDGALREVNGLTIHATDTWSGCRAMSPSTLSAVLDHGGRRYTLSSGQAAACGGIWGVDREAFAEILYGLRPAP